MARSLGLSNLLVFGLSDARIPANSPPKRCSNHLSRQSLEGVFCELRLCRVLGTRAASKLRCPSVLFEGAIFRSRPPAPRK
jgi:hypothetical protein